MSNYVLIYRGGQEQPSPEEGAKGMARWQAWLQGLGEAVVNPGIPFGESKTVSADSVSDGSGPDPLTGFTIVEAGSMDAALEMAKSCPFLEMGSIIVAQAMEM